LVSVFKGTPRELRVSYAIQTSIVSITGGT
jgi:hypothetical protein